MDKERKIWEEEGEETWEIMESVCFDRSIPASKNARAGDMPSTRIVEIL